MPAFSPKGSASDFSGPVSLAGTLPEEQNDEWAIGRRYFSTESTNRLYEPSQEEVVQALLELHRS